MWLSSILDQFSCFDMDYIRLCSGALLLNFASVPAFVSFCDFVLHFLFLGTGLAFFWIKCHEFARLHVSATCHSQCEHRGFHCPINGTLKPKKSLIKPVLVTHGCTDALASCHTKSRYTACHYGSQCHTVAPSSFLYRVKIHSCLQSFWIMLHRALFFLNLLMPMLKGSEDNTATVIPAATYTFERSVLESRVRWTPKSNWQMFASICGCYLIFVSFSLSASPILSALENVGVSM